MKFSKYIILLILMVFSLQQVKAQQEPQYSQYMFNGLVLNPAYAGVRNAFSATMLLREQWVGIEGAPSTQTISLHAPGRKQVNSYGFSLYHDRLGITKQTAFNGAYAYRFDLGPGRLAFGLQAGGLIYTNNWSEIGTVDEEVPRATQRMFLPQVGTGAFYDTPRFYAGFSVPNLILNKYQKNNNDRNVAAKQVMHMFFTTGAIFKLNNDLDIKPSILVKYAKNAPLQVDLNANLFIKKTFWVGLSYRTGDAVLMMFEYVHKNRLRIGYAYDYSITELSKYNSGSHELMLGFDFGFKKSRLITPRYL